MPAHISWPARSNLQLAGRHPVDFALIPWYCLLLVQEHPPMITETGIGENLEERVINTHPY
jgi:hypothetical protein